jgi:hypothetical protein
MPQFFCKKVAPRVGFKLKIMPMRAFARPAI